MAVVDPSSDTAVSSGYATQKEITAKGKRKGTAEEKLQEPERSEPQQEYEFQRRDR